MPTLQLRLGGWCQACVARPGQAIRLRCFARPTAARCQRGRSRERQLVAMAAPAAVWTDSSLANTTPWILSRQHLGYRIYSGAEGKPATGRDFERIQLGSHLPTVHNVDHDSHILQHAWRFRYVERLSVQERSCPSAALRTSPVVDSARLQRRNSRRRPTQRWAPVGQAGAKGGVPHNRSMNRGMRPSPRSGELPSRTMLPGMPGCAITLRTSKPAHQQSRDPNRQ
jgi:hypothetical protein